MTQNYLDRVAAHLDDLPADARRTALADLRELLDAGVSPDELGSPEAYASQLTIDFDDEQDPAEPQATAFGVPFEARSAADAGVRSRIWNPQDPRLIVPRLLGGGWMLNLGAVAVRLGLLRPDDWDDEALDRVPAWVLQSFRFAPIALAVATLAAATVAYRSGDRIPTHFAAGGRADRWADHRWAWLPPAIAAGVATWGALPTTGDDRMVRPALANYGTGMAAALTAITAYAATHPGRRAPLALLAIPVAGLVKSFALPVTIGVRRGWAQAGRRGEPAS